MMLGITFQKVEVIISIGLYPQQLLDIPASIHVSLNGLIGQYVKAYRGLIICYSEEIGMLEEQGSIMDEDPRVYFRIRAEFLVLKIKPGEIAQGYLEEVSEEIHELSAHGILPVEVKTREKKKPGVYRYKITSIDIKRMKINGEYV